MIVSGTVLGVTGRNTKTGQVCYDVACQLELTAPMPDSDTGAILINGPGVVSQKLATFDGDLASAAQQLTGQRVSLDVDGKKNGRWVNVYLNGIAPEGQISEAAVQTSPAGVAGIPIAPASTGGGYSGKKGGGGGGYQKDPEVQRMIVKQNVLGTAHEFIGKFYEGLGPEFLAQATAQALAHAQKLYGIVTAGYESGATTAPAPASVAAVPAAAPVETAPIVPIATTPQEVAAAIPGVAVGTAAVTAPAAGAADAELAWV